MSTSTAFTFHNSHISRLTSLINSLTDILTDILTTTSQERGHRRSQSHPGQGRPQPPTSLSINPGNTIISSQHYKILRLVLSYCFIILDRKGRRSN